MDILQFVNDFFVSEGITQNIEFHYAVETEEDYILLQNNNEDVDTDLMNQYFEAEMRIYVVTIELHIKGYNNSRLLKDQLRSLFYKKMQFKNFELDGVKCASVDAKPALHSGTDNSQRDVWIFDIELQFKE